MKKRTLTVVLAVSALALGLAPGQMGVGSATTDHRDLWINRTLTRAENGDTLKLQGAGTWSLDGTTRPDIQGFFVHRRANGRVVGRGIWRATAVNSFTSYGTIPDTPFEGGKLVLSAKFRSFQGDRVEFTDLTVTCLVGDQVPEGEIEGVTVGPFQEEQETEGAHRVTLFAQA